MLSSMLQPAEMLPAAAIGAMTFAFWRLLSARVPAVGKEKGGKLSDEESLDNDLSNDNDSTEEAGAEPSPEPLPGDGEDMSLAFANCCEVCNDYSDDARPASTRRESKVGRRLVVLVIVAGLGLCAHQMMAMTLETSLQTEETQSTNTGSLDVSGLSNLSMHATEAIRDLAEEEEQTEQGTTESSQMIKADTIAEELLSVPEDNEEEDDIDTSGGKVVTLNLTRQQMLIPGGTKGTLYYKSAYWGVVQVGSPAVAFKVVFDTGSGHLVLPSTYCKSNACTVHKRYSRAKSSSAVDIDYDGSIVEKGAPRDKLTVSFGTGEISGVFVEETVCMEDFNSMGNRSADDLPVVPAGEFDQGVGCMKLRMIIATDMTADPFETFKFDGVLGMGLSGLSQAPEFNFMNVVAQSVGAWGGKRPARFAFFLGEKHEVSKLTLGGYEKDKVDGQLKWNPVWRPELGHWLVQIKSIRIDGNEINFCKDGTCRAVVDTGTSLMAVPSAAFPEVFSQLRHKASSDGDCQGPGPNLHFDLEAITVTIEPQEYARLEENKAQNLKKWPKFGEGPENKSSLLRDFYCKPMLMAMDLPEPIGPKLFILGEPVLRKYYSVYDTATPPRVGLARAMHADWPQEDLNIDESWFDEDDE